MSSVYPFALILLDLITGGTGKALGGIVGLIAGHLWFVIPGGIQLLS
jgi:Derlin-2/3